MANNYTQFSFAIALADDEQREWATKALAYIAAVEEGDVEPSEGDELYSLLPDDPDYTGYFAKLDDDGLWIYAEESGSPSDAVNLAMGYLAKFDPTGYVAFEWAEFCSKPRLDEFGGGAVFVTATDAKFMASSDWIVDQIKAHEGGRS